MSKVSEFMETNVVSINPDDSLEKVLGIFKEKKINGLPVVDSDNKVIGIITARDLLKYSEKTEFTPLAFYNDLLPEYTFVLDDAAFKNSVKDYLKSTVDEAMSKKVYTVKPDNSWHSVAALMKKREINRLPVVDDDGKLVGIVTRNNLLNYLSEHEDLY